MPIRGRSWRVERKAIGIGLLVLWVLSFVTSRAEWVALLIGFLLIALGILMLVDWEETIRSYTEAYSRWGWGTMDPRGIRFTAAVSALGVAAIGLVVIGSIVARSW